MSIREACQVASCGQVNALSQTVTVGGSQAERKSSGTTMKAARCLPTGGQRLASQAQIAGGHLA